ncbi:MAG: hypothetical protein IJ733_14750 [Lachnospiraceae bacterium]|nr:hypothetical protein [Lachnospiraceae bacterium]
MSDNKKATMQVGYYPLGKKFGKYFHHTYAIMEYNGQNYEFHCYGGVKGDGNVYPAEMVSPSFSVNLPNTKKTACNPTIARLICTWGGTIDESRTVYNRKRGGHSLLGDNAGILYGPMGVCHQICNTILLSTSLEEPKWTYINSAPSVYLSAILLGFWGIFGHNLAAFTYTSILKSKYGALIENGNTEELMKAIDKDTSGELASATAKQNSQFKLYLTQGASADKRTEIILDSVSALMNKAGTQIDKKRFKTESEFDTLIETDAKIMKQKQELDNLLMKDNISHTEYADKTNGLIKILAEKYVSVMDNDKVEQLLSYEDIINPEFMQDIPYHDFAKELGI